MIIKSIPKNLKYRLIAQLVVLLGLVVSIVALTFSWYTTNGSVGSKPTEIATLVIADKTLGIEETGSGGGSNPTVLIESLVGIVSAAPTISTSTTFKESADGSSGNVEVVDSFDWYRRTPLGLQQYVKPITETNIHSYGGNFTYNQLYDLHIYMSESDPPQYIHDIGCTANFAVITDDEGSEALRRSLAYALILEGETENEMVFHSNYHSSDGSFVLAKNQAFIYYPTSTVRLYIWIDTLASATQNSLSTQIGTVSSAYELSLIDLSRASLNLDFQFIQV